MPKNAHIDVDEVHSLINEVNSWHQPIVPPIEPGNWSQPRGGGDDADARTDDSKGTLTVQQYEGYTYDTTAAEASRGKYASYGGGGEGETGEDNNDGYEDDATCDCGYDDDVISQTTAWPESESSSVAGKPLSRYSQSTAPSHREVDPEQQADDLAVEEATRGPLLVCEFRDLCGCPEIFNSNETEAWIEHIGGHHLGYKFPAKSVCWFCDDQVFDSEVVDRKGKRTKKASSGEDKADKRERRAHAFRQRLEHVAWHIVDQRHYKYLHMRPDFRLMKHMRKHGLLDDETYNFAIAFEDARRPLSSPKPEKQRRIKTNPPDWEPPHKILERERKSQIIYDQPKEDRQLKKEKDSKKKRGS